MQTTIHKHHLRDRHFDTVVISNPEGSTRYVFRPTNRPVYPTQRSHVNFVVAEPYSWQEVAAQTLDRMECVVAYVRNTYLDFRVPYTIGDENKDYRPDFIVKVKKPDETEVNLIVECQDFDGDNSGHKDDKRHYLRDYWRPAANNLKTYGEWQLLEVRDIEQLENLINEKIK